MACRLWLIFIVLPFSAYFARAQIASSSEEIFRKRGEELFQTLDVDKDGYLVGQEIPGDIRAILNESRAKPDTRLGLQEFLKFRESAYLLQVASVFKNHDRDGDGFLQKHEMPLSLMKRLEKYSSGRDRVNFQEFLQFSRDRDFPLQAPAKGTEPAIPRPPLVDPASRAQSEKGLKTSEEVFRKRGEHLFQSLDVDKDGYLVGEEIPADIRAILHQAMARPDTRLNLSQFLEYREIAYFNQVSEIFKNHDLDGDGILQKHEMPLSLMKRLDKYSRGDRVTFQDFLKYSRDREFAPPQPSPPRSEPAKKSVEPTPRPLTVDQTELYVPPLVYRAGKLPKGLPEWFEEADTDKDGQVALYEWRKFGMPLAEFAQWDRNDDGFITIEEVLYKLKEDLAQAKKEEQARAKKKKVR